MNSYTLREGTRGLTRCYASSASALIVLDISSRCDVCREATQSCAGRGQTVTGSTPMLIEVCAQCWCEKRNHAPYRYLDGTGHTVDSLPIIRDRRENYRPPFPRQRGGSHHKIGLSYAEYLRSDWWKERRALAIQQAGGRCQVCNSPDSLNVHHRSYDRLGYEPLSDLTVLCRPCHALFHEGGRMPK